MLKGHPKGLYVAFFANMGERFGFYTMMAILVLFLQAKFGLSAEKAGDIYSWFYFAIYALALLGGILADATKKYTAVISLGQIIMFVGYIMMAVPGLPYSVTVVALFTIAIGNGFFKGNLQAVVGQLYDDPKYDKVRDNAFLIFYMGINVGAFFAPFAAMGVRNWWLKSNGFLHDGSIPALCHQYKDGILENTSVFQQLADAVSLNGPVTDLGAFANSYIDVFSKGYNFAFGIAAIAMVISLMAYLIFHKHLPKREKVAGEKTLTLREKPLAIPAMTFFARDYTVKTVGQGTFMFFTLWRILSVIVFIAGIVLLMGKNTFKNKRIIGAVMTIVGGSVGYYLYSQGNASNPIAPEVFQSFNPLFIVSLTFVVMAAFAWLNKKGMEPSTPKKIAIGMVIAAMGFVVMVIGSLHLVSPVDLQVLNDAGDVVQVNPVPDSSRIMPYWLMSTYLVLTFAELFLSPMGLSFVSKVAPTRFQGVMQGGWLLATAVGNKLLFIGSFFWEKIQLWQLWGIFVVTCLLSAMFIFSILKKLENATK